MKSKRAKERSFPKKQIRKDALSGTVTTMKKLWIFLFCTLFLCLFTLGVCASDTSSEAPAAVDAVVGFLTENTDEILGILTLISSLLIAFLYKSGLLPLLRNGISALADTAGKTGKMTELFTQKAQEELDALKQNTAPLQELMEKAESYLRATSEALAHTEQSEKEMRDILAAETALFYELLSSVNLPEAQKENMSDRYYKLLKKLEASE